MEELVQKENSRGRGRARGRGRGRPTKRRMESCSLERAPGKTRRESKTARAMRAAEIEETVTARKDNLEVILL